MILVDYDRICVTNVNRQLHAMKGTLGKSKVEVMAERLRLINPDAVIEARAEFYSAETSARLLVPEPDVVIDAIDNIAAKMHLIATCVRDKLRCVSAMGAAARLDPTLVRIGDLSETRVDPFARDLRQNLRRKHGARLHEARRACGRCTPRSRRSHRRRSPTTTARSAACAPAARTASTTASTGTASRARSRSCRRCSAPTAASVAVQAAVRDAAAEAAAVDADAPRPRRPNRLAPAPS